MEEENLVKLIFLDVFGLSDEFTGTRDDVKRKKKVLTTSTDIFVSFSALDTFSRHLMEVSSLEMCFMA
jgi:hypothetical protein